MNRIDAELPSRTWRFLRLKGPWAAAAVIAASLAARSPALAQDDPFVRLLGGTAVATVAVTIGASVNVTSVNGSTASSRSGGPAGPAANASAVSQCRRDNDCQADSTCYRFSNGVGRCVQPAGARPSPPPRPPNAPAEGEPPPALSPIPEQKCTTDEACGVGRSCVDGGCLLVPPVPPPVRPEEAPRKPLTPPAPASSLLRRGFELYLRDRGVELREELALGQGPVISSLAAMRRVDARVFGRVMRSHRAELVELIGEGSGPDWAGNFLRRVEAFEEECRRS